MGVSVRAVTRKDISESARVLADAFFDDPVMEWMWPDPARRRRGLPLLFAADMKYHHLAGGRAELAVDADGVVRGAAMWDPPGRWKQSTWSSVLSLPRLVQAFGGRLGVGAAVSGTIDSAHPAEPRHWYLATIGTSGAGRGGGYGKALMQSRLDRCDAEGLPSYLESSKQGNIPYYERFGFEVTREIRIPDGGPAVWAMWREPRRDPLG
ncbi:GNAT family N-acetyltransferase [Rhodococcus oxybenzonivorans]|uniref:GNAT family N-acetyltransferase n=1 Tax=Rhodococcus oxybenzonivorans TaxID=1990687 RepID=A0A2S2BTU9_9NOCA|nr:GNAT family N-acetyltransferase [Rhodococcus oxybenzonivorans]AWK72065.1 GNAT family N-acetyltransferase [Rhodococcus oxybenzonivorans]